MGKIPGQALLQNPNSLLRQAVRGIGLAPALRAIRDGRQRRRLTQRFGADFKNRQIGEITLQGLTFPFRDPTLAYLLREYRGEEYEPAVMSHLKTLVGSGRPTFLDMGAYLGVFATFVGKLNPECRVHAFEPSPKYLAVLRENVALNDLDVHVHGLALSDAHGEVEFGDRSFRVHEGERPTTVQAIPFDDLRRQEGIRAEIVKLDVHGCEGKVLFGMQAALREDVQHMYLEVHPHELLVDYDARQIVDLVVDAGLHVFEVEEFRGGTRPRFVPLADRYESLVDRELWTEDQVNNRRMLFATRQPQAAVTPE